MKRRTTSFLAGVVFTVLLLALGTTALAASGKVAFSFANIALNGETKIMAGSTITAPNGQQIPGSILYTDEIGGKTNYLPIRAISDLLGVEIDYDSATKTVHLGEQPVAQTYQNALRGDTTLILARGGTLLPDDDPESYVTIEGVAYKMFAAKSSDSNLIPMMYEYEVGNKDALWESDLKLVEALVNGEYPKNSRGESYGYLSLANYVGYYPDLYNAKGTTGESGYLYMPETRVSYNLPASECPHEFMIPLYDSEHEQIGEYAIGCGGHLTETPGMTIEEAKKIIAEGSADTENTASLSVEQTSLVSGDFPRNSHGETYGTGLMINEVGYKPDLQAAIGTDGQEGYVRTSDLAHPRFQTPQEAFEWQLSQPASYFIPLYDFEGNEIGSFLVERNSLTIAEMEAMKAARDED